MSAPTNPMKYFSYDPDDGLELHETEEKAKARAEQSLGYHQDESSGEGWPENTHRICWGMLLGKVECIKEVERPPESELDDDDCDHSGTHWPPQFDVMQEFALLAVDHSADPKQMRAHERASALFIEAEKLGCDTPTEGMVADAIHTAECEVRNELLFDLKEGGFEQAATAVENWRALNRSREQE